MRYLRDLSWVFTVNYSSRQACNSGVTPCSRSYRGRFDWRYSGRAAHVLANHLQVPFLLRDLEKAAAALQAPPLVAFEDNATIIVQAPVLTVEDKKAIGTIRRYGVAADVIIMTGGLSEALDNGDVRQAKSFLAKAKGSLDEVIGVARGGGLR